MKAEDLMIGDLVKWKEQEGFTDEDRKTVMRVKRVLQGEIWIDGRYCSYNEVLFEPIPLTSELLERNGFVKGYGAAWNTYRHSIKKWFVLFKKEFGLPFILEKLNLGLIMFTNSSTSCACFALKVKSNCSTNCTNNHTII